MAAFNGNILNVYISTDAGVTKKLAVCLSSAELSVETNQVDTTSKCNDGWTSSKPGNKSWTLSGEGFAERDSATAGQLSSKEFFDLWDSDTEFTIYWKDANGSYRNYSGTAYIGSLTETANTDEMVTYSVEFIGTGTLSLS